MIKLEVDEAGQPISMHDNGFHLPPPEMVNHYASPVNNAISASFLAAAPRAIFSSVAHSWHTMCSKSNRFIT